MIISESLRLYSFNITSYLNFTLNEFDELIRCVRISQHWAHCPSQGGGEGAWRGSLRVGVSGWKSQTPSVKGGEEGVGGVQHRWAQEPMEEIRGGHHTFQKRGENLPFKM